MHPDRAACAPPHAPPHAPPFTRHSAAAGTRAIKSEEIEGEIVAELDPIRILVETSMGVSQVFGVPTAFDVMRGGSLVKKTDHVSAPELQQSTTTVYVRRLCPSPVFDADQDDAEIVMKTSSMADTLVTRGSFVRPLNPKIVRDDETDIAKELKVPIFSARVLMEVHYAEISSGERQQITKLEGPPLQDMTAKPVFVVDGTECGDGEEEEEAPAAAAATTTSKSRKVKCEICSQLWLMKEMRNHVGAHILCESAEEWASKYDIEK